MPDPYRIQHRLTTLRKRHPDAREYEVRIDNHATDPDKVTLVYVAGGLVERLVDADRPRSEVLARKTTNTVTLTLAEYEAALEAKYDRGYERGREDSRYDWQS